MVAVTPRHVGNASLRCTPYTWRSGRVRQPNYRCVNPPVLQAGVGAARTATLVGALTDIGQPFRRQLDPRRGVDGRVERDLVRRAGGHDLVEADPGQRFEVVGAGGLVELELDSCSVDLLSDATEGEPVGVALSGW